MTAENEITVISRSYDRTIRRTWKASLIRKEPPLIELVGQFDRDVDHPELGHIKCGTVSYEYYWLDRWYNVFRFHEPTGELRNYYCNINMPPTFTDGVLDYVDLDIDVLVDADLSFQILDRAEFEETRQRCSIPESICDQVERSLEDVLELIKLRGFPFNAQRL
jgi:protein associated with RNAse G/E